jgi:hypothetical protein
MTFWVAGAAIVGTVGGALINSNAVGSAADQQAASTATAQAENARQYDQTRADYAPYMAAGTKALATYATENDTPLDVSNLQMDPGYQFGQTQGQQAIDRQAAAAGGRISGAALKAAAQYNTDYANTGYSAAYGRAKQTRDDRLARLGALAGIGQVATNSSTAAGQITTTSNNALTQAAGANSGSATLAQGGIWGNATNQIAALYGRNSNGTSSSSSASLNAPYGASAYDQTANFDHYGTGYSS